MPITLTDILDERQIALQLRSRTKTNALRELIELCASTRAIQDQETFLGQVLAREAAGSTLADNGIAFPHARTGLVSRIVLAIGLSRAGIPWNDLNERAQLIFLVAVPQQLVTDYLVLVGALARISKDQERRQALLGAATPADFIEILRNAPSL